jgi:hypothetical protein
MAGEKEGKAEAENEHSGRPEEDAESVFSDSEEEEGEFLAGRRDVASDEEDGGPEGEAQIARPSGAAGNVAVIPSEWPMILMRRAFLLEAEKHHIRRL